MKLRKIEAFFFFLEGSSLPKSWQDAVFHLHPEMLDPQERAPTD